MDKTIVVGFVGQGWIGSNYANDFEARGYKVVRYGLEPDYIKNRDQIKDCDVVFIAVPTPTTPLGFDFSIVEQSVGLVGEGKIAVIKSTIIPGTTKLIQDKYPNIFVLHSPEFLTESTASFDAGHPARNIIGIPKDSLEYQKKAEMVLDVLPKAPYKKICSSTDAEIIKYGRNISGFFRVIFANILYDLSMKTGSDWSVIKEAMSADPDTGPTYLNPVHKSGRGAGGHCFIKDFSAFAKLYEELLSSEDVLGLEVLKILEKKNLDLLKISKKDLDLVRGVYGDDFLL